MYELIITEKPKAAEKIAQALADGKPIKKINQGVPYYEVTHGNKDIVVGCAVGHLFTLAEKKKVGWKFPVFDIEWKPSSEVNEESQFSKKYLDTLKKLSKNADSFVVATDYDIEGEVIGLNAIRYICKQKDAKRMKFSTLTKPDLIEAYDHVSPHLDWGQAEAGETRHILDWFYGINTSRALTASIKSIGRYKVMSTGRVQGPTLKIIIDKEKEIKAFKPVSYWQIEMDGEAEKKKIEAWHKEDKFWEKAKAEAVMKKVKGAKKAKVANVDRREFNQTPPFPFDLTSLQTEAYRCFGIAPKITLEIAQELYTSGFISYPRTSSQILPPNIGYNKVLSEISKQMHYKELCHRLLAKKSLAPNNGTKTDPAHPAIYPTGIHPKGLNEKEEKIYDLIVRRFLATFADPAVRLTIKIDIDCNNEIFIAKGTTTLKKGWHEFYGKYADFKEEELPNVKQGQDVDVKSIKLHSKETQPPNRYTEASIIKELERKNLGTKSTRASVIDTLFQRGYIKGKPIEATELGTKTIETLEKYSPRIIDEELTRHFEDEMEQIRELKIKKEPVLEEAKQALIKIMEDFKKHDKEIGKELSEAHFETKKAEAYIGPCPVCGEGELRLIFSKKTKKRFIACDKYPECETTFPIPQSGFIKPSKEVCKECSYPMIASIRKGRQPQYVCINPKCPSKKISKEMTKEIQKLNEEERPCPKCKEGKLVLRSSIYGQFFGCSKYPKCRFIEKIPKKEE